MDGVKNLKTSSSIFYNEALDITFRYPKLSVIRKDNQILLAGEIDLVDTSGEIQDLYSIEIHPSEDYPLTFPLLFEKGGRLPHNIDWHVHNDGHCCIKTPAEELLTCINGITLNKFIELEVIPYLYNQTYRRLKGYFLNERSHGILGEIEFLQEFFNEKQLSNIVKYLLFALNNNEPNRVAVCFCESKEKYRKCHRETFRKLKRIGKKEIQLIVKRIIFSSNYYEENPIDAVKYRRYFRA